VASSDQLLRLGDLVAHRTALATRAAAIHWSGCDRKISYHPGGALRSVEWDFTPSRRIVRYDDRAACGECATHTMEPWHRGPAPWGCAAHLAHALVHCVRAVHAGMQVGEAAAIGVERQFAAGRAV
jgi:hypothetical protein